jgi:O-antigen ligase
MSSSAAVHPFVPSEALPGTTDGPDQRWDLLLVCLAGYILTSVGRVHQLFPLLEILRPAIITGLLGITLYLIDRREDRQARLLWTATTKWLLALFVWMALSVPGALITGYSFDLVFDNFIKTMLMYAVMVGAVRGVRDVERLTGAYLLGAATYACVVLSRFDIGDGEAWRLGRLYYYDGNDFATFAVTAIPLGLYFATAGRRLRTRLLAVAALGVLTLAFVRSGSRGGFVALVAVAGFIVLRYTAVALRWRLSLLGLVGVLLLSTASDTYWQQMGTILSDDDYNHTEESGRVQIWRRGIGYMLEHPMFGVGPNNFGAAEGMLSPFAARQHFGIPVRWNAPHNSFVQAGAELGIPGLVFFLAFIASAFTALGRARRPGVAVSDRDGSRSDLTHALSASLIGFIVGAFFLSLAYSEMLYTLVALAAGLHKVTQLRQRHRRSGSVAPHQRSGRSTASVWTMPTSRIPTLGARPLTPARRAAGGD